MNTALSVYADTLRREKKQILVLDIHQNLDYLCIVTLILKCDKNILNVGKTNSTQFDYILALTEFEPTHPKFYQDSFSFINTDPASNTVRGTRYVFNKYFNVELFSSK